MPVSAEIDRENRVVCTTATGLLTKADFTQRIETTWRDASQLEAADLSAIVNSGVVYDPKSDPRLALCFSSELTFGLARMFGTMCETYLENARQVQAFQDVESATAWLAEQS